MKTKIYYLLFISLLAINTSVKAQINILDDTTYDTTAQMLFANEAFESGEPFAESLGYDLDILDPMVLNTPDSLAYTLGIENYEYSRYNLGTLTGRSGMGLHMMWSPVVMANAAMQPNSFDGSMTGGTPNGYKEDDIFMKMMMHFGMITNHTPPMNGFPQFADFYSGQNTLPQAVASDFQTNWQSLRWDRSQMTKILNLGAMGQSMSKQYLWAQDMLSAFHDANDNSIDADGSNSPDLPNSPDFDPNNNIFYGGDGLDGFIGTMLTAVSINKTKFVISQLAYDGNNLGNIDPASYDPVNGIKYFPHMISVTEMPTTTGLPPKADSFNVTDAASQLFDQLSFLTATLGFVNMMNPTDNSDSAHLAYHEVFDGDPFPAPMSVTGTPGPYDLMKGTSKVLFMNIMAMHYNSTVGTFVDESGLNAGVPIQGDVISAVNAAYMIVTLEKMSAEFSGTPLQSGADVALIAQADYIIQHFKDPLGGFYNSYQIGVGPDSNAQTLASNAALARALYVAYRATNDNTYLQEANAAYNLIINNFYMSQSKMFETELNNTMATYTPWEVAIVSGLLREATLIGNQQEAANIYTRFFKSVVNKMQLTEAEQTGETGGDSDGDGIPYIVGTHKPFVLAHRVSFDTSLGISQQEINQLQISLYPNPTTDLANVSINLKNNANLQFKIFDLNGRLVSDIEAQNVIGQQKMQVNVQNLSKGIYISRLLVNGEIVMIKKLLIK